MSCSMLYTRSYNSDNCDDIGLWDFSSWFTKHGYGKSMIASCGRWSLLNWLNPLTHSIFRAFPSPMLDFYVM